jgi:dienelactone hydrolase
MEQGRSGHEHRVACRGGAHRSRRTIVFLLCAITAGCAGLDPAERLEETWRHGTMSSTLPVWYAIQDGPDEGLTVFIEGDGRAYETRHRAARDPTPRHPVGLHLAYATPGKRAYLARPCQFRRDDRCLATLWTTERYGSTVRTAMHAALDSLRQQAAASSLTLIGFSGGGSLALLLASEREDVDGVVTVAANLDTDVWTRHHAVTPLSSVNPSDRAGALRSLPQVHLHGMRDTIVPGSVGEAYRHALGESASAVFLEYPDHAHHCCWAKAWPHLYADIRDTLKQLAAMP